MFTAQDRNGRHSASSSYIEGKPSAPIGTMSCCDAEMVRKASKRWWRAASAGGSSGMLLMLLPKCPMCIAAYLAVWTGAGVAMQVAVHLRSMVEILFAASVLLLVVRRVAMRMRYEGRDGPLVE